MVYTVDVTVRIKVEAENHKEIHDAFCGSGSLDLTIRADQDIGVYGTPFPETYQGVALMGWDIQK